MDVALAHRISQKQIKVCPVVVRQLNTGLDILLFRHPLAGVQLVKGTLEITDESIEFAAVRELQEESGIDNVVFTRYLGEWDSGFDNQLWHFVLCQTDTSLRDRWVFHTLDDGGHKFEFFWFALGKKVDFNCHPVFTRALDYLAGNLIVP